MEDPYLCRESPEGLLLCGPGWPGAVNLLSTVPMVDGVVLGFGASNKGQDPSSLYKQFVCRRTLPLGRKSL